VRSTLAADAVRLESVNGDAHATLDERRLVELARTDPEAFAELYRRYVARVHAFAYRRCGATDVAEDITSASFERALRNLGSFEWRPSGFGPWLFRIAANELTDHHRRRARDTSDRARLAARALLPDAQADPADEIGRRDTAAAVLAAMDRLNPRYQEALSLRYLSGLSPAEAAAAMGTSRGNMAVLLFRATRALRRVMDSEAPR
jgi:RNA polymerase sigma-70 factor (ECF subfamily)